MAVKRGLGRGMAALLPEENYSPAVSVKDGVITLIPLEKIKANPDQPRKDFNNEGLAELADSIRQHGIIQPVIAEEAGDGSFIIVAGERRIRAAKIAGLKEVPVIVKKYSDEKRMVVALIENIQRSDLNPIEEAAAYKKLMELTGLSQDEAAKRLGKNRSTVANSLRLLRLSGEMQESLKKGEISAGHARAILSSSNSRNQGLIYGEILKKNLSVREAEKLAAQLSSGEKNGKLIEKPSPTTKYPELDDMEEKFLNRLGTKVKIKGNLSSGTIEIYYHSMEDLDRLYELLS